MSDGALAWLSNEIIAGVGREEDLGVRKEVLRMMVEKCNINMGDDGAKAEAAFEAVKCLCT